MFRSGLSTPGQSVWSPSELALIMPADRATLDGWLQWAGRDNILVLLTEVTMEHTMKEI